MTLLPDLPPVERPAVPMPSDGPARAAALGRLRRRRAVAPVLVAAVVAGGVLSLQSFGSTLEHAQPAAGGDLPSTYLTYSTPVGGQGAARLELRSAADGSLQRSIPRQTGSGDITGIYALGAGDAFVVRRLGPSSETKLCGGELMRVNGKTGVESVVLSVPADRGVTAVALSREARSLAYALVDCANEAQINSDSSADLIVRDLGSGVEQHFATRGGVGGLSWSPDARALLVVGSQNGPGGSDTAHVVAVRDLAAAPTMFTADAGCGLRGAAWGADGLYTVSSCGSDGNGTQSLQRFSTVGVAERRIALPTCSLGTGISADAETGRVLTWVNSTGNCEPMNRLLYLDDDALVDLPTPSRDRLWTAVW